MLDFLTLLFDTAGFPARKECGTSWTTPLIWLHVTSDLFIWLAYVSIPLILLYFTRRRDLPFPRLFVLFALFILACGTTHLVDALVFEYPIYRFAGLMKLITAIVSWVTVIALVPVVPRVMSMVHEASQPGEDTKFHRPLPATASSARMRRLRDYGIAVAAALVAVSIRAAIDPLLGSDNVFVVALLAVVYVSWQCGFGPGILCLAIGLGGYTYFFVSPRHTLFVEGFGNQLAVALFFFCGVACAALGESHRTAHRRAHRAVETAEARQLALESEVVHRRVVEVALRKSEEAQKERTEELAHANSALRDMDRRKDEFLATMAHELRNPLAPIRNALEIIRLAGDKGESIGRQRARMERQIVHMQRLVDDLLDVSRITIGKLTLRLEALTLQDVLEAALETSRPLIEKAKLELLLKIPSEPIPLTGDRVRLAQSVTNLLHNAAKFTEPGGRVWLSAAASPEWITITVRDSGVGIPPELLPDIFTLFTQVDRTLNRSQGGLGIGLALVRRLVEMHGGTVEAASEGHGRGTTFTIALPATKHA